MRKTNFEASVCRESDQHDWRFFITYQCGDEWESCIFDANPDGLESACKMDDVREFMLRDVGYTREVVDAYFHACDLNDRIHRADWNSHFPVHDTAA